MASRPWTDAEVAQLRELAQRGWSASRIGRQLGRTPGAVNYKLYTLGLTGPSRPRGAVRWLEWD